MEITAASYGKSEVRVLLCADRVGEPGATTELTFTITVEGELLDSYRHGDNRAILPSDTLRRHALAVCAESDPIGDDGGGVPLHVLVERIGRRILDANPAFTATTVSATRTAWSPVGEHTFVDARRPTTATAIVTSTSVEHHGNAADIRVLLTTGSAFTGFLRDAATVQADASDRPLSGTLAASWSFLAGVGAPACAAPDGVVGALLASLADRPSNSVQQWLTAAAATVLDAIAVLASLALHFTSIPIAALPPAGLGAVATGTSDTVSPGARTFELGTAPLGVTTVTLAR